MKCELNELCFYVKDKELISNINLNNYISTENMLPNKNGITIATTLPNVDKVIGFKKGDVLISNIRPYFKKIWYAEFDGGCSNDVLVLRPYDNVSSRYLYCILSDDSFFDYTTKTAKGTKMPRGDKDAIMKYSVPRFTKQIQEKIATMIFDFNYKINLNNQINDNLEMQISGFYENIFSTNDWISCELDNLIDVRDGTHDSPKPQNEGYLLVTSKHLLPYGIDRIAPNRIIEKDFKKINERSLVEKGDVLMSMIGTIGLISFVTDNIIDFAIKNVALFKTSKSPEFVYYFLSFLKSKKTQQYIEMCLAGSTQKYISLKELRKIPIPNPDSITLKHFNEIVIPMYQTIVQNSKENIVLTKVRDTILPKLMSGELDVSDIEF